jgi:protein-S-isoprenylcysteine O-methyltransferase Ste14
MKTPRSEPQTSDSSGRIKLLFRSILFILVILVGLDAMLFLSAGTTEWPAAWIFTVLYSGFLVFFMLYTAYFDPQLLEERGKTAANVKSWDKTISFIYTFLLLGMLILCGLDYGRFGWSSVPIWVQIAGFTGILAGGVLIAWVIRENTFLSRYARIQDDRGQTVISSGPYQYVRHPMYAGSLFWFPCIPLYLGSWVGLVPGLAISILYVVRTCLEDRMLMEELPGYSTYAEKTRFRLIPGVW